MKTKLFLLVIPVMAAFLSSCSSTFLVSKDGKGYFFGSKSQSIYRMLCDSGDLKKILSDTTFTQNIKNDIYRYNCTDERSSEKVKQLFSAMTIDQRKELRTAFKNNGYDINYLPC